VVLIAQLDADHLGRSGGSSGDQKSQNHLLIVEIRESLDHSKDEMFVDSTYDWIHVERSV
jgi:hypothetical protein